MKRNTSRKLMLTTIAVLAAISGCLAQTADKNYIIKYTPQVPVTDETVVPGLSKESVQKAISYFDGLGRTDQVIQVAGSPLGYDIVTPVAYDDYGREDTKFLPYALTAANNGAFVSAVVTGQSTFYTNVFGSTDGIKAFAKTDFEPSPLNRVLKQGAPGAAWQPNADAASDHSVKLAYGTNIASEVKRWKVVSDVLTPDGDYTVATLYKTTTWDENNNQTLTTASHTEEFKDLQGKVVLKRSYNGTEKLSTYYVYDDLELLRVVIPPLANGDGGDVAAVLNDLCYQYRYDERKRMTMKKIPGADAVYLVYDQRDRLVATQDGVQRAKSPDEWTFTKYDALNRPVMTGIYIVTDGTTPATVLATVNGFGVYSEDCITTGYGYSNSSFPTNITEADILSLTYYDNYTYTGITGFSAVSYLSSYDIDTYTDNDGTANGYFDKVKGLVTGTKTKVLDGNEYTASAKWLCSANYYDDHYRVIQNRHSLYDGATGGVETLAYLYDFPGKVIQTKQAQTYNSVTTTVDKYYAYDHAGRLLKTDQEITGDANGRVNVAENTYNEIGQLIDKKLHKTISFDYLQSVDYAYNIRGWLTSINNPDDLSTLQSGDPNIDLFGEKLFYETSESGLNTSALAQYNGNISAMSWNSTQKTKQGYGFTYDGLNRLKESDHKNFTSAWMDNTNYEEKSLDYDKNGNINLLIRTNSVGSNIDDYTYTYNGNKLLNINSGTAYTYDLNGNTTLDGLRGVSIGYNILNLPKTVSKNSDIITYIYSAAGEKLAKKMKDNTYQYYAGNMVYKNDKSLNYLLFDEGLVTKTSTLYSYEYHLKDHLGNTRVTFQPNGSTTTTTQVAEYYPFGSSYLPVSPAGTNKYLYNGKEKQDDILSNTALDWYDYGARFYDPQIGRWHSMEPYAELVPGISTYAYCYNDPINFSEPTGKWPGWVHKKIIRKALNPYLGHGLTEPQLDAIIAAGEKIDRENQSAADSKMHSMSDGTKDESVTEAIEARDEWVNSKIALFKRTGEYSYLGEAIHAISDEPAPSHSWKPWYGQSKWNPSAWVHGARELNILGSWGNRFQLSVDLVVKMYSENAPVYTPSLALTPGLMPSTQPAPSRAPAPAPMNPRPWKPIPIPAPAPVKIDPRQLPLPRPQPRG